MRAMAYAAGGRESWATDFAAIISLGEISEGGSWKVRINAGGTLEVVRGFERGRGHNSRTEELRSEVTLRKCGSKPAHFASYKLDN